MNYPEFNKMGLTDSQVDDIKESISRIVQLSVTVSDHNHHFSIYENNSDGIRNLSLRIRTSGDRFQFAVGLWGSPREDGRLKLKAYLEDQHADDWRFQKGEIELSARKKSASKKQTNIGNVLYFTPSSNCRAKIFSLDALHSHREDIAALAKDILDKLNGVNYFTVDYSTCRLADETGEEPDDEIMDDEIDFIQCGIDKGAPCFWKFSFEGLEQRKVWEERHVLSMPRASTKKKNPEPIDFQRELFQYAVRVGDFVYVCDGIKILSLVKITNVRNVKNSGEEFNECDCEIIVHANKESTYNDEFKRNWTPNADVKFVRVPVGVGDYEEFDNKILNPYFGKTVDELTAMSNVERKYWWLVSDPTIWKLSDMEVGIKGEESYFVYKQDGARGRRQNPTAFISCREGDTVIGYVSKGDKADASSQSACAILQIFKVPYFNAREWNAAKNEEVSFIKKQDLITPVKVSELQNDTVLKRVADRVAQIVSLFDITKDEYCAFMKLAKELNPNLELPISVDDDSSLSEIEWADGIGRPRNLIRFGAPGTGKSFGLKKEACGSEDENGKFQPGKFENRWERVTFYPTYSYAQFVGTYKPVMKPIIGNDGKDELDAKGNVKEDISYEFVPGPFLRMLVKALNEPEKDWCLIIEEINRANAAAVFGDVFQLLDRGSDGDSEYAIAASEDIKKHLKKKLDGKGKSKLTKLTGSQVDSDGDVDLKIPRNMYIWATMNSADQGVFPMDTAFKRRWEFEYIGVDEEADADKKKGEDARCTKWTIDGVNYNWDEVRRVINGLLSANGVNEDKLMGPYFIQPATKEETSITLGAFSSKVLMYLWEDAGRMIRRKLFGDEINTYSKLVKKWGEEKVGIRVFEDAVKRDKDKLDKQDEDIRDFYNKLAEKSGNSGGSST